MIEETSDRDAVAFGAPIISARILRSAGRRSNLGADHPTVTTQSQPIFNKEFRVPNRRRCTRWAEARSFSCEPLESRTVLSAQVVDGVLRVVGSADADSITITTTEANGVVVLRGVPGVPEATPFSGVNSIRVDLKSGDDSLFVHGNFRATNGQVAPMLVLGGNGEDEVDLTLLTNGQIEVRGGSGSDTLTGSPLADVLKGGKQSDQVLGLGGNDELHGQKGIDVLVGGAADDTLLGGDGPDSLWGGPGANTLRGGKGPDVMFGGGSGLNLAFGEGGRDTFNVTGSEAEDFGPADVNFNQVFGSSPDSVLLPTSFWSRLAPAEAAGQGTLPQDYVDAVAALASARSSVSAEQEAFVAEMPNLNAPGQKAQVLQELFEVTNAFSPQFHQAPALLTDAALIDLRDDLVAALPIGVPNNFRARFIAVNSGLINALVANSYVPLVNGLIPNSTVTLGVIFGADAVFNHADDF